MRLAERGAAERRRDRGQSPHLTPIKHSAIAQLTLGVAARSPGDPRAVQPKGLIGSACQRGRVDRCQDTKGQRFGRRAAHRHLGVDRDLAVPTRFQLQPDAGNPVGIGTHDQLPHPGQIIAVGPQGCLWRANAERDRRVGEGIPGCCAKDRDCQWHHHGRT